MPQASTSHGWLFRHQPRVKSVPFTPPPLNRLYAAYEAADPNKTLRYGQWFFNSQLNGTIREIKYPYNLDMLYNSTDFSEIMDIITKMYLDYQWPLA